jgi:hypothetical protein
VTTLQHFSHLHTITLHKQAAVAVQQVSATCHDLPNHTYLDLPHLLLNSSF